MAITKYNFKYEIDSPKDLIVFECVFFPNILCGNIKIDNCIGVILLTLFFVENTLPLHFGISRKVNARNIWQLQNTVIILIGSILNEGFAHFIHELQMPQGMVSCWMLFP